MKKTLLSLTFSIIAVTFLIKSPVYANQAGVNLGGIWNSAGIMTDAAGMVGNGGWITVLSCELEKLEPALAQAQNANIIIRLYNGGSVFKPDDAPAFVKMLGDLNTNGHKIYVMPWNEPNMTRECGGSANCAASVNSFIEKLKTELDRSGLWPNKVYLLSPALNQTCPTVSTCQNYVSFVNEIKGINPNFWGQFDGIALNVYIDKNNNPNPQASDVNNVLSAIGVSLPAYAVEAGLVDNGVVYNDSDMATFLTRAYSAWGNVVAITPFAYNPEAGNNNSYIFNGATRNTYNAISNQGRTNPGGVGTEEGTNFGAWKTANCLSEESCQVSNQYCAGMVRSCVPPEKPSKDPCCPDVGIKTESQKGSILDNATSYAALVDKLLGGIETLLDWMSPIVASINYSGIESPGKDLSNLVGGNPNTQTEVLEGAKAIECSGGEGAAWCNGTADFFSLPTDPRNTNNGQGKVTAWKTPVESKFETKTQSDTGSPDERQGGENLTEVVVDETKFAMFDSPAIKSGLDAMSFLKYPESGKTATADVNVNQSQKLADASLAQGGSVLPAETGKIVDTHGLCQPPDTNDQIQNTCEENLSIGLTQPENEIEILRAFRYILNGEVEFKTNLEIPYGKDFEKYFWRSISEGENTPENIKDASQYIGATNIFQIPTEEPAKALPAEGVAKADIGIFVKPPAAVCWALGVFGQPCDYGKYKIMAKQVDVKLKFRGMGVMGDMQTIAQKMEVPSGGEAAAEAPTAQRAVQVEGTSTVKHELSLSEKIGSGIGNLLSGIFSL